MANSRNLIAILVILFAVFFVNVNSVFAQSSNAYIEYAAVNSVMYDPIEVPKASLESFQWGPYISPFDVASDSELAWAVNGHWAYVKVTNPSGVEHFSGSVRLTKVFLGGYEFSGWSGPAKNIAYLGPGESFYTYLPLYLPSVSTGRWVWTIELYEEGSSLPLDTKQMSFDVIEGWQYPEFSGSNDFGQIIDVDLHISYLQQLEGQLKWLSDANAFYRKMEKLGQVISDLKLPKKVSTIGGAISKLIGVITLPLSAADAARDTADVHVWNPLLLYEPYKLSALGIDVSDLDHKYPIFVSWGNVQYRRDDPLPVPGASNIFGVKYDRAIIFVSFPEGVLIDYPTPTFQKTYAGTTELVYVLDYNDQRLLPKLTVQTQDMVFYVKRPKWGEQYNIGSTISLLVGPFKEPVEDISTQNPLEHPYSAAVRRYDFWQSEPKNAVWYAIGKDTSTFTVMPDPKIINPFGVDFSKIDVQYLAPAPNGDVRFIVKGTPVQPGETPVNATAEAERFMKYFKTGLAIPNYKQVVSMPLDGVDVQSPFEQTEAARIMLTNDVDLKMEEKDLKCGVVRDTFNAKGTQSFSFRQAIVSGTLKANTSGNDIYLPEGDFGIEIELQNPRGTDWAAYFDSKLQSIYKPPVKQAVNTKSNYDELRLVYKAFALAQWYKTLNRANLPLANLIDSQNISGVESSTPWNPDYWKQQSNQFICNVGTFGSENWELHGGVQFTYLPINLQGAINAEVQALIDGALLNLSAEKDGYYYLSGTLEIPGPDLVPLYVWASNTTPVTDDTVTLHAVVRNKGDEAITAPFKVGFYDSTAKIDGRKGAFLIGEATVDGLNAGETKNVSANWNTGQLVGTHGIFVEVDSARAISEASDLNNLWYQEINVFSRYPTAQIDLPVSGGVFPTNYSIALVGGGTDIQDGIVSSQKTEWSSNIDGALGVGNYLAVSTLSEGNHVITLKVTDSEGLSGTKQANIIIVPPQYPQPIIVSPLNNAVYAEGETIYFENIGAGSRYSSLNVALVWGSNMDGVIGTGSSVQLRNLSVGTHTIELKVMDGANVISSDSRTITIEEGTPIAAINPIDQAKTVTGNNDFFFGKAVTLSGSASDPQDGNLMGTSLVWESNIDGLLGSGASITTNLSSGLHTITLAATDRHGLKDSESINVLVYQPQHPGVSIIQPRKGEILEHGKTAILRGFASDPEDGNLPDAAYRWSSSRDGALTIGSYAELTNLSVGNHTVYLTATDSSGLSTTTSTTITVRSSTPFALVNSPLTGQIFMQGEAITLSGSGEDLEDGILSGSSLSWNSSRDGSLGAGGTLSVNTLSAGTHKLTLTATDSSGRSGSASVNIILVSPQEKLLNTFPDGATQKTLVFNSSGVQTVGLDLAKDATVSYSSVDVSGECAGVCPSQTFTEKLDDFTYLNASATNASILNGATIRNNLAWDDTNSKFSLFPSIVKTPDVVLEEATDVFRYWTNSVLRITAGGGSAVLQSYPSTNGFYYGMWIKVMQDPSNNDGITNIEQKIISESGGWMSVSWDRVGDGNYWIISYHNPTDGKTYYSCDSAGGWSISPCHSGDNGGYWWSSNNPDGYNFYFLSDSGNIRACINTVLDQTIYCSYPLPYQNFGGIDTPVRLQLTVANSVKVQYGRLNFGAYPTMLPHTVQSTVLPTNGQYITKAILTAPYEQRPPLTSIDYYLSTNSGNSWTECSPDVQCTLPGGNQLMWKADLTTNSNLATPRIDDVIIAYSGQNPVNPSLDVANDGTKEWSYSGEFATTEITPDMKQQFQDYLTSTCTTATCNIPLAFSSDSLGALKVSNIDVQYKVADKTPPEISSFVLNPQGPFHPGDNFQLSVNASDNAGVDSVYATLNAADVPLSNIGGLYSGTLTAPLPGDYALFVTAQDTSNITTTVNTTFSVYSATPELIVESLELPEAEIGDGDQAIVTSNISNFGDAAANNFIVSLLVNGVAVDNKTISISAKSKVQEQFIWSAIVGNYTVSIKADATNEISEANESNNVLSKNIVVYDRIPPTIGDIEFNLNGQGTMGTKGLGTMATPSNLQIRVNIEDNSNIERAVAVIQTQPQQPAGALGIFAEPLANGSQSNEIVLNNVSNSTYEGSSSLQLPSGIYPVVITVFDENGLSTSRQTSLAVEGDEDDLAVLPSDVSYAQNGNSVEITATMRNKGAADLSGYVEFLVDTVQVHNQTSVVPAKSNTTIGFAINATIGAHILTVKVDPQNNIAEAREDNNIAEKEILVADTLPPIVADVAIAPEVIYAGTAIDIEAWATDNIQVSEVSAKLDASAVTLTNANGTFFGTIISGSEGTKVLEITATDSNGLSSTLYKEITVYSTTPDLAINSENVSLPAGFLNNVPATVNVAVHNYGMQTVSNAVVKLYIDGQEKDSKTVSISGRSASSIDLSFTPTLGEHELKISVDPENSVSELDEGNNGYKTAIFVVTAPPAAPQLTVAPDGWSTSATRTVSWGAVESDAGIAKYEYKVDDGNWISAGTATSITLPPLSEGTHIVAVRAIDIIEQIGAESTATLSIDSTAPSAPILNEWTSRGSWTGQNRSSLSWTGAVDSGSGAKNYLLQIGQNTPIAVENTTYEIEGLATGIHTAKVKAVDHVGLESEWSNIVEIYIDTTVPFAANVSSSTHPDENSWYTDRTPVFTWSAPSDESGISGYYFMADNVPNTVIDNTYLWATSNSFDFAAMISMISTNNSTAEPGLSNGTWYFHAATVDGVGNIGGTAHYKFNIGDVIVKPPSAGSGGGDAGGAGGSGGGGGGGGTSKPKETTIQKKETGGKFNLPLFGGQKSTPSGTESSTISDSSQIENAAQVKGRAPTGFIALFNGTNLAAIIGAILMAAVVIVFAYLKRKQIK